MRAALEYLPLVLLNILLLILVIRWRGVLSFEGLGLSLLLVVISLDFLALLARALAAPGDPEVSRTLGGRLYPGFVHALGILTLAAGLFVADPAPVRALTQPNDPDRRYLGRTGILLAALGLGMKIIALSSAGIVSLFQYLISLGSYTVQQGKYGGFLDKGTSIALFGLCLLSAGQGARMFRQVVLLLVMVLVSLALSASRADTIAVLLMFAFTTAVLNRPFLRALLARRRRIAIAVPALAFLVLLNAGVKSQLRAISSPDDLDFSLGTVLGWGTGRLQDRFTDEGLYDGYSNLVNRLSEAAAPPFRGRVLEYTLTAWVPYLLYSSKPQHPFRDVGDLIYRDFHSSPEDVSASTLIGSAFADHGVLSVLAYLPLYGMVLGALRRVALRGRPGQVLTVWYLHVTLIDGATNFIHGGIVNLIDGLALATGVLSLAALASAFGSFLRSLVLLAATPGRGEGGVA